MKELLEEVAQAGLDQDRGLFRATPEGLAYPNPAAGGWRWAAALVLVLVQTQAGVGSAGWEPGPEPRCDPVQRWQCIPQHWVTTMHACIASACFPETPLDNPTQYI